jgi:hypothetical protein
MEYLIPALIGLAVLAVVATPLLRRGSGAGATDASFDEGVDRYRAALRGGTLCPDCLRANAAGSAFCTECGAALKPAAGEAA